MAKMKIYEIAKSLDTKSSELIKELNENGFEVRSHNSNIEDEAIAFILKKYSHKNDTAKKEDKKLETKENLKPMENTKTTVTQETSKKTESTKDTQEVQKPQSSQETQTNQAPQNNQKPQNNQNSQNNQKPQNNPNYKGNQHSPNYKGNQNNPRPQNSQHSPNYKGNPNNPRPQNSQNSQNSQHSPNYQGNPNNPRPQNNSNYGNPRPQNGQGTQTNQRTQTNSQNRPQFNNRTEGSGTAMNQNNRTNQNQNSSGGNGQKSNFDRNNNQRQNTYNNRNNRNNKNKNNRNIGNNGAPKKDPNRKGAFIMPKPVVVEQESEDTIKTITLAEVMTIKELADKIKIQPSVIVKKLFLAGKMVSINSEVTFEEAEEMALEYNCIAVLEEKVDIIEELLKEEEDDESTLVKRPAVVCVMGHVDHGKTSLLDAIRTTHVTDKEAGGITQHIGAYTVNAGGEKITFLDTPGHEAFTSMRMRGAQSTDIAILVVAADDGVMPQTIEAISHAKAAGVEIIVAINKIDKPSANIERVKQELVEHELIAEDWGGSTVFVPVSAHSGEGIPQLLEMIILTAEVLELKANPNRKARGVVIEAQLDKGRGPVATILVQKGTLHVGDSIAIGSAYGKVRAMMDDKGRRVKEATPSTPVEILGLNEVPDAGEIFMVQDNEKEARAIAEAYIKQGREKLLDDTKARLSLDGLFSQIQAGNIKELNLIVKADVQGSVEAVKQSLLKLTNEEVAIRIIHGGVGAVNESDVTLASASNAIIIGFNVRPDATAKETAEREKVDLRLYRVIYNAIEDIEAAMKGMLDPIFEEKVIGHAQVRQVFKASGIGTIAGSYVLDGKIVRGCSVRITRAGEGIFEGSLASLKRFKDDVKEVATGYECGLVFEKFNSIQEDDLVEAYIMQEVPR